MQNEQKRSATGSITCGVVPPSKEIQALQPKFRGKYQPKHKIIMSCDHTRRVNSLTTWTRFVSKFSFLLHVFSNCRIRDSIPNRITYILSIKSTSNRSNDLEVFEIPSHLVRTTILEFSLKRVNNQSKLDPSCMLCPPNPLTHIFAESLFTKLLRYGQLRQDSLVRASRGVQSGKVNPKVHAAG